jgi:hypothetical protein
MKYLFFVRSIGFAFYNYKNTKKNLCELRIELNIMLFVMHLINNIKLMIKTFSPSLKVYILIYNMKNLHTLINTAAKKSKKSKIQV